MKRIIYGLLALLMLGLVSGCGSQEAAQPQPQRVKTQRIDLAAQELGSEYSGQVVGRYETNLSFQVGGRILERYVDVGAVVHAGDVLMRLDSRDVQQSVSGSAAQVAAAQAQLKLAEADLNRYRQLFAQEAVSAAVYDQYRTAYDAAAAALRQAQAQYEQSGNSLGYTELTAQADGVISQVNVEAGQVVAAGQTAAVLVSAQEREIEMNVPENALAALQAAPSISVTFWALPEQPPVSAVVREISPVADSVTRTYRVRLQLAELVSAVQLGMTAQVRVAGSSSGAVQVPLSALYQTGDTAGVWVIENGQAQLRPVSVSGWGDNAVYIGTGISDGDVVITAGVHKLTAGQSVVPMDGDVK